jgi:FkbM family methyltransferase
MPLSDTVGRELYVHGAFEWDCVGKVLEHLPPDGTFVDVGAHVGSFSLYAARAVGVGGRVFSIEPDVCNRARLVDHLAMNNLERIAQVVPFAVSDTECFLPLGSPSIENSGMSRLGVGDLLVECKTLDGLIDELDIHRFDVLKIDVEGYEAQVLRGGRRSIETFHPTIVSEVNDEEVLTVLVHELGYDVYLVSDDHQVFPGDDLALLRRHGQALNIYAHSAKSHA